MGGWFSSDTEKQRRQETVDPDTEKQRRQETVDPEWRKFHCKYVTPWSEEHLEELQRAIPNIEMAPQRNVQKGNLVFIGPVASGKSSFINSVLSSIKGRIAHTATEGNFPHSTTRKLSQFMCGNVLVTDTMGIEGDTVERYGITVEDIISVVNGHVSPDYKFDSTNPITRESPYYNANPGNADKVHCVVMCVDAAVIIGMPIESRRKLRCIQRELCEIGVPTILLLTKIDTICSAVKEDTSYTYRSKKVKGVVKAAHEMIGISEKFIFPVRNFTDEMDLDVHASILILFALKKALESAQDHIETLMRE